MPAGVSYPRCLHHGSHLRRRRGRGHHRQGSVPRAETAQGQQVTVSPLLALKRALITCMAVPVYQMTSEGPT